LCVAFPCGEFVEGLRICALHEDGVVYINSTQTYTEI